MPALFRLVAFCALALVLAPNAALTALARSSHEESLAGRWQLYWYGKCSVTRNNIRACRDLQSPATFPATDVPGATLTVIGRGTYLADRLGHYTVRFSTTITERVPGAPAPAHCSNGMVFTRVFTGVCTEVGTGHGHIAPGRTHMPEFWQDDAAGAWSARPAARFAESVTTDTFNPACPGDYDTARFMRLFGYRTVPAGITARVILTHTGQGR